MPDFNQLKQRIHDLELISQELIFQTKAKIDLGILKLTEKYQKLKIKEKWSDEEYTTKLNVAKTNYLALQKAKSEGKTKLK